MAFFVAIASSCPEAERRLGSDQVAYENTDVLDSLDPGDASGTKSVAHRSGKSSTTSHVDSAESCRAGLGPRSAMGVVDRLGPLPDGEVKREP